MHLYQTWSCIMASFVLWSKDSVNIKSAFKYFLRLSKCQSSSVVLRKGSDWTGGKEVKAVIAKIHLSF